MSNWILINLINLCEAEILPNVGQTLAGFKCDAIDKVGVLTVFQLSHVKTEVKTIAVKGNYYRENIEINIKALVQSDDGYLHLLQHILPDYPSRKYNFKNGLAHLRELTFVNYAAATEGDTTIYSISSPEPKDLENILEYLLDHLFHSKFDKYPESLEEGWRYELDSVDSHIMYNGVIAADGEDPLNNLIQSKLDPLLYPDTSYRHNPRGSRSTLLQVNRTKLVEYYRNNYHLGNLRINLFFNTKLESRLDILNEYISELPNKMGETTLPVQKPLTKVKNVLLELPQGLGQDQFDLHITWVLPPQSTDLVVLYKILLHYLAHPDGPLRKNFVDVVADIYPANIRHDTIKIFIFHAEEDKTRMVGIVNSVLRKLCTEGFDEKLLEETINEVESMHENEGNGLPASGLNPFMIASFRGDNPSSHLYSQEQYDRLRTNRGSKVSANAKQKLKNLVKNLIISKHRVNLQIKVSVRARKEFLQDQTTSLAKYENSLTKDEKIELVEKTQNRREESHVRQSLEDTSNFRLKLEDLTPFESEKAPTVQTISETRVYFTHSKLALLEGRFIAVSFDVPFIKKEDLEYVVLLHNFIRSSGVLSAFSTSEENTDKSRYFRLLYAMDLPGLKTLGEILSLNFGEEYLKDPRIFREFPLGQTFIFFHEGKIYDDVSEDFKFDKDKMNSVARKLFSRDRSSMGNCVVGVGLSERGRNSRQSIVRVIKNFLSKIPLSKPHGPRQYEPPLPLSRKRTFAPVPKGQIYANSITLQLSYGEKRFPGEEMGNLILDKVYITTYIINHGSLDQYHYVTASRSIITFKIFDVRSCGEFIDLFVETGDYLANLKLSDGMMEFYKVQLLKKEGRTIADYLADQLHKKKGEKRRRDEIIKTSLADIHEYGISLKAMIQNGIFYVEGNSTCLAEAKKRISTLNTNT